MIGAGAHVVGPRRLLFYVHHGALGLETVLEHCPGAQLEGQDDPQERAASGGQDHGPGGGAQRNQEP
jgi:hypothetical protein